MMKKYGTVKITGIGSALKKLGFQERRATFGPHKLYAHENGAVVALPTNFRNQKLAPMVLRSTAKIVANSNLATEDSFVQMVTGTTDDSLSK